MISIVCQAAACLGIGAASLPARSIRADTLPPFEGVTASADSAKLIAAASDALHGMSGITVPMVVVRFSREKNVVLVELTPIESPRVKWNNLGGTVRILADGRRVILSRK